jgi:hypothetical protein
VSALSGRRLDVRPNIKGCDDSSDGLTRGLRCDIAPRAKGDEVHTWLQGCKRYFVTALIFSLAINLLYLGAG